MAAEPRPAATVVLVRPASDGWETYLLRRSGESRAFADLWVFPGGTLRPDDSGESTRTFCPDFLPGTAHSALIRAPDDPPSSPEESLGYFVCAARELFEEAGVLLARKAGAPGGGPLALEAERVAMERRQVHEGRPLAETTAGLGLTLGLDQLIYYAHWITPEALLQRFDTRFFLARLPAGQIATPDAVELIEGLWIGARNALDRSKTGELSLHFATINHLRRLAAYEGIDELLTFAATKAVVPVLPSTRPRNGGYVPYLAPELDGAW